MYYPQEIIEQVIDANNIADVIGEYVKLTKKGTTYFGLCPFHNEKTPSFSVTDNGSKQMYYCFGCHKGGSVLTFIMEYENYTYTEALKFLAKRAGITLPEPDYSQSKKAAEKARLKEGILSANKEAALYYYALLKTDHGKAAYEYLTERGLDNETIKKFGLGYSEKYRDDLYKYLKEKGFSDEVLKASGLVSIKETDTHDIFWNRVMFPIMDANSKVIGFGGRVLGEGEPKYLNTQETVCFEKNRNLYGLNYAKKYKGKALILCEGYMDVIALHKAGFSNAVASLGTSLTKGHAMLLKRYTDNVFISYDADSAGRKAALRAIPILRDANLSVKVVDQSPYKDPDELIKACGAEEYEKRLSSALNSLIFEIYMLKESYNLDDIDEKTKFENETAKRLSFLNDEFERENYVKAVSQTFDIDYAALKSKAARQALNRDRGEHFRPERTFEEKKKTEAKQAVDICEEMVLSYLAAEPSFFDKIKDIITPNCFRAEPYETVARTLFAQLEKGRVNIAGILSEFEDADQQEHALEILNFDFENKDKESLNKALTDSIIRIKKNIIDEELQNEEDAAKLVELYKEKEKLEKFRLEGE